LTVFEGLLATKKKKGAGFLILVDPDENNLVDLPNFVHAAEQAGVDAFLVGASLLVSDSFPQTVAQIKKHTDLPVIIFPGSAQQVCGSADAILFLTLLSGRNPQFLIGEQVKGAPAIKAAALEVIPTGYLLIESGRITSVQYVSTSLPLPADKPARVKAHALAGQYLGLKLAYLEAGSGALYSVPEEIINATAEYVDIPLVVGGGITTPEDAHGKVTAGASFVVIGNFFEKRGSISLLSEFAQAIHCLSGSEVEIER